MNSNRYKLLSILCISMICMESCIKKPLDQKPTGSYTTATYWRNQNDVIANVLGIYNVLYVEDWVGHALYTYDDQSDDIYVAGDHSDFQAVGNLNADPSLQVIYYTWPFAYEQIGRANNAIFYIPKVPVMDDAIRSRSMGEAYFLRAYAYFLLSQIYGEVPIITEANVQASNYNVPKATLDQVRAQVESDLLKAINLLPETYDAADKGRVSKGAAEGLLSKLYLFEDDFAKSIQYGTAVINDANYSLAPNYDDNFTPGIQQTTSNELLFAVWNQNSEISGSLQSPMAIYFSPRPWQGWGFHHPTQNFVDEFETGDKREKTTVLAVGDSIPYQTNLSVISPEDAVQMFTGKAGQSTGRMLPSMSTTGYYIRKYTAYMPSGDGNLNFDLKQPLLRTAEIYLIVAEAKIRQSGAGSGDAEINAVRVRAGLEPVAGAGMKQLIHEKRVELGGENVRWQDLLRWDKDQIVNLDTIVGKPKKASPLPPYNGAVIVPARTFQRPKDYFMPIPQKIIDESKGVIKQNPNY
ncbi:RagB/SusD family nutrient uptake outer membrane protein [Mucilaginibacter ginsenosidivorans]|uniref:RagB/SusD family nutrient uptake outer membrane protein n=2 Tax=Mucilaginibacter ginsenosidivorans TaxID=398053 RepID=A0A5B8UYA5_9SPHI|nr:RagB/SusD family nutrient uptake outer membrane protein [Mucilaginibacter ginsenosidivorans]